MKRLDLAYFIRRSAVLRQYRHLLRASRDLERLRPDGVGVDAARQIKTEFRVYQREVDKATVAVLLKQGEKHLQVLYSLLGKEQRQDKGNEWLGKTDEDGKDERGRVGQGWPWQRPS